MDQIPCLFSRCELVGEFLAKFFQNDPYKSTLCVNLTVAVQHPVPPSQGRPGKGSIQGLTASNDKRQFGIKQSTLPSFLLAKRLTPLRKRPRGSLTLADTRDGVFRTSNRIRGICETLNEENIRKCSIRVGQSIFCRESEDKSFSGYRTGRI